MANDDGHTLVVGTRGSRLARWQTDFVIAKLQSLYPQIGCRVLTFKTIGDDIVDRPLPELGGKGVFTTRLEAALLRGDIDIAVHSLKDLPVEDTPGLTLGAILSRVDARDVLISRDGSDLDSLPRGAVVGTSSLRRQAQLLLARPDLTIRSIRGNVETRVRKVKNGEYDATVLAAAGVDRLGLGNAVSDRLSIEVMLPAPGQGALAVQCRASDRTTLSLLQAIDDPADRAASLAERAFLAGLGGGCAAPVAAFAITQRDGSVAMKGLVADPNGSRSVRVNGEGADALALAAKLAEQAIAKGARDILRSSRDALEARLPLHGKRIVVTRAANPDDELCAALSGLGATPLSLPMIRVVPLVDAQTIANVATKAQRGDWIVFTSANGVSAVWNALAGDTPVNPFADLRVAAVGERTAGALLDRSVVANYVPDEFTGEAVAQGMPGIDGKQVWLLRAQTAGETMVNVLAKRGAVVHDVPVYRTEPHAIDAAGLQELENGIDAITFTSGSTARNFKAACEKIGYVSAKLDNALIACIGPAAAKTAGELGFNVGIVAREHTTSGLVDALVDYYSEVIHDRSDTA